MLRISESEDWTVDYDPGCGMYKVSYFRNSRYIDECWFDAYEEREVNDRDIAKPVIRFERYNHEWWAGICPNCSKIIGFDFSVSKGEEGKRKSYCSKCGQLCDFEDMAVV